MGDILWLLAIAPVGFVQNVTFSLAGRSRVSADPKYHRKCAWLSNGTWFVCYVLIMKNIWEPIMQGDFIHVAIALFIYTVATAEGSVLGMKYLLKTEKGKRRVGARGN